MTARVPANFQWQSRCPKIQVYETTSPTKIRSQICSQKSSSIAKASMTTLFKQSTELSKSYIYDDL